MRQKICSKIGNCVLVVETCEVIRFAAEDKYIVAHTPTKSVCFEGTLKALEEEFAADFVRIHRSHLVRRSQLTGLRWDGYLASVSLRGCAERIPVARPRCAHVRSLLEGSPIGPRQIQEVGSPISEQTLFIDASNGDEPLLCFSGGEW
ncbi:LytTR family DNA-binding domain-containing protein [Pseudomonas knackmussii]|uniref:LytTR family DNA-binding domain-containing protein n=1 Tax=Pseudomonas knackmussii TaxID=65741 RepID=UPI003BE79296